MYHLWQGGRRDIEYIRCSMGGGGTGDGQQYARRLEYSEVVMPHRAVVSGRGSRM